MLTDSPTPNSNRAAMSWLTFWTSPVPAETTPQNKKACCIGDFRSVAINQPSSRNLQQGIRPEEHGTQQPPVSIGQPEKLAEIRERQNYREICAIDIGDHHAYRKKHDHEPLACCTRP